MKGRRRNRGDVQGYFKEFPEARLIGLGNASYTQVQKLKKQMQRLNDRVKQKQSATKKEAA